MDKKWLTGDASLLRNDMGALNDLHSTFLECISKKSIVDISDELETVSIIYHS